MKRRNFFKSIGFLTAAAYFRPGMVGISNSSGVLPYSLNPYQKFGPDDGPNQPIGKAVGINPGRVVWAWDPNAVKDVSNDYFFKSGYNNQEVVSKMLSDSVRNLAGKKTVARSWNALFRDFNKKKLSENKGYTSGEKIFIKINQTSSRGRLNKQLRSEGKYHIPDDLPEAQKKRIGIGICETTPYLVLGLLRQLIYECGIEQENIAIGDPQNPLYGHNYEVWSKEFPDIVYTDNTFGTHGRTLITPSAEGLIFYSDKSETEKLYDICQNANYLINVANFKPHLRAGITLTAKNHFGSQTVLSANHLHHSLISPLAEAHPTNAGYKKYRVLVDLMGSKYLGNNTLLFIVDGLWGGGAAEVGPPVKYMMAPFNNDWCKSIFMSQDQVALESVCYDFLRAEWNGINIHDSSNNKIETMPNVNGVDDYLHQAADSRYWPEGIIYDPDNNGKPITSLGIHEHWNNAVDKQYSRNLGKDYGIELISI